MASGIRHAHFTELTRTQLPAQPVFGPEDNSFDRGEAAVESARSSGALTEPCNNPAGDSAVPSPGDLRPDFEKYNAEIS
jgi:hypothetical protein